MYKIVIDTKGSDKGAAEIVAGAAAAINAYEELFTVIVGDEELIKSECEKLGVPSNRYEIINAVDEINNYDNATAAIFAKPEASIIKGLEATSARDDISAMLCAGNTGALIAGTIRHLSKPDRTRPALAAILPAADGSLTCLVDTGATVDCSAPILHHFAKLGSSFMKEAYGIESPRVGLVSNGAEPTKGNKIVKETHAILAADEELNFIGNVEGNVALSGMCDVLVADGFVGNQVLKVSEGMAKRLLTDIVKYAKKTENESIMQLFGHLMKVYDFGSLGGGIILGARKLVVKARGTADKTAILNVCGMILNMLKNNKVFEEKNTKA